MNILVIGCGYVGLVTGTCFAELGSNVICTDIDKEKIERLNKGEILIYEPNLEELFKNNFINTKRLTFTTDINEAVQKSQVIILSVGTPTLEDGSVDLSYIFQAAGEIGRYMNDYKVIVDKSTVPVGTARKVKEEIKNVLIQRNKSVDFDIVSNPEFLREGTAVKDFINPDRIVLGFESEKALGIMKSIYNIHKYMNISIICTNLETAEMIKYASNAFLAAKISYINEIANICENCGADINVVAYAMGKDKRIGAQFLKAGPGFGGSCFPKDTKALINIGKTAGYIPKIVKSAIKVNYNQPIRMFRKIKKAVGNLKEKTITILGLAFKPETDDIRESPAIPIIELLLKAGATVKVFDPKAMDNFKKCYPELDLVYCDNEYSACKNSDCIVLVTEWEQFTKLDFLRIKLLVRVPVFIDLRNVYKPEDVRCEGFIYEGVGIK